jgi:hypothetical protein
MVDVADEDLRRDLTHLLARVESLEIRTRRSDDEVGTLFACLTDVLNARCDALRCLVAGVRAGIELEAEFDEDARGTQLALTLVAALEGLAVALEPDLTAALYERAGVLAGSPLAPPSPRTR